MSKYKEFSGLNLPSIEKEILAKWDETNAFQQSIDLKEGATPFVFYEGPPSANGMPGIHHVISRTLKDLVCRYKTMQGFQVKRKGGWDTHGLPIELGVEKELGIKTVLMGFGLDSDNLHSPNEKYNVANFYRGIETIPLFYKHHAQLSTLNQVDKAGLVFNK